MFAGSDFVFACLLILVEGLVMLLDVSISGWSIGILAAVLVGLGKGGLPGTGNLSIILMAMIFASKESVGVLLPVLICADVVAVSVYHEHARWDYLLKLLPWTLVGVVIGALVFKRMDDELLTKAIGSILLLMVLIRPLNQYFKRHQDEINQKDSVWTLVFVILTGVLGGFATMVANAAGPVVAIYLLVSGLPKYAFIGTSAWFFFIINLCKMPIQVGVGNITWDSVKVSLILGFFAALAAFVAPRLVKHIPQKLFGFLIWAFVVVAGVKMVL